MKKADRDKAGSKKLYLSHSEAATATAIGAVLLLGIIFLVLSIITIYYIPEWKSDAEYSHMDDVWEDMIYVKSKIDMMTIILASHPCSSDLKSSNPSPSVPQLVMSVPFHMGGGDIPLIGSIKSSGSLAVNKDKCKMEITVSHTDSNPPPISIDCSTITYSSQNRYYTDQVFSYECGALILNQGEQSSVMLSPSILFSRTPTNKYNISINAVRIFQKPYYPPEVVSSNTKCSLCLTGVNYRPLYDNAGNISKFVLTVNTAHPEAWEQYLNKIIGEANIKPGEYDLKPDGNNVILTFPSGTNTKGVERLYVSETVVRAQPGIGLS